MQLLANIVDQIVPNFRGSVIIMHMDLLKLWIIVLKRLFFKFFFFFWSRRCCRKVILPHSTIDRVCFVFLVYNNCVILSNLWLQLLLTQPVWLRVKIKKKNKQTNKAKKKRKLAQIKIDWRQDSVDVQSYVQLLQTRWPLTCIASFSVSGHAKERRWKKKTKQNKKKQAYLTFWSFTIFGATLTYVTEMLAMVGIMITIQAWLEC